MVAFYRFQSKYLFAHKFLKIPIAAQKLPKFKKFLQNGKVVHKVAWATYHPLISAYAQCELKMVITDGA